MINGDGSRRSGVQLTFPNNDDEYALYAQPAVVAGQLHLFGGMTIDRFSEYRKVIKQSFYIFYLNKIFSQIARLDGCAIVELSARLTSSSSGSHAALAIEDGSKGSRFSNQFFYFLKRSSVSETLLHTQTVTSLMALQLWRHSLQVIRIGMQVLDSTTISQQQLVTGTRKEPAKLRPLGQTAGQDSQTSKRKFLF